jgi:hypothetical protein
MEVKIAEDDGRAVDAGRGRAQAPWTANSRSLQSKASWLIKSHESLKKVAVPAPGLPSSKSIAAGEVANGVGLMRHARRQVRRKAAAGKMMTRWEVICGSREPRGGGG